jgi:hypothetical protein
MLLFAPALLTNALASIGVLALAVGGSLLVARFGTPRTA